MSISHRLKEVVIVGVDFKRKNKKGESALHVAAQNGHEVVCSILLEQGLLEECICPFCHMNHDWLGMHGLEHCGAP